MASPSRSAVVTYIPKHRQRLVLPKWIELGACARCRARKIKCARLDEESSQCHACKLKAVPCQSTRNRSPGLMEPRVTAHSPDAIIQRAELSESVLSHLLATFFETADDSMSYDYAHAIQSSFDNAGRRLHQLDKLAEPLVLTMIACSTQFSDSPILLGSNAPNLKQLTTLRCMDNAVQFGHRRRAICTELIKRVLTLTDTRGIYRKASLQSIAVLTILPRLLRSPTAFNEMDDTWRPFMAAAMEHIRLLCLKQPSIVHDAKFGQIQWTVMIGDAITSAYTGHPLLVTDDDIEDFPIMASDQSITPDLVYAYAISSNINEFLIPHILATSKIVRIGRKIVKTISIPMFRQRKFNLDCFAECIEELRATLKLFRECQQVAHQIGPLALPSTLEIQKDIVGATVLTIIKHVPVVLAIFMPALYNHFAKYIEERYSGEALQAEERANGLFSMRLREQMELGSIEAVTTMADMIEDLEGAELVSLLTSQTSILVTSHEHLVHFINLAFAIPTNEETQTHHLWTLAVKQQKLRTLIDALRLQQWAWSDLGPAVATSERQFEQCFGFARSQLQTISLHENKSSLQSFSAHTDWSLSANFQAGAHSYMDGGDWLSGQYWNQNVHNNPHASRRRQTEWSTSFPPDSTSSYIQLEIT